MLIRKYKKNDELGIIQLDKLTETHPWNRRNLKNWNWKYKGKNPSGKSLVWVVEDKKKIIGTFSILPLYYQLGTKIVKGSNSIAMIIHPKWQNKGLIKFVADKLFLDAIKNKIKFVYGYPNLNSYELHKRVFGYKDIGQQNLFYKKLKKVKNLDFSYQIENIYKFDKSFDELWSRSKKQYNTLNIRSSKFLNWRYLDRPDHKYFCFKFIKKNILCGYIVLKIYQFKKIKTGHFIDIFMDQSQKNLFENMINFGSKFFTDNNCNDSSLWMQGSTRFQTKLIKLDFKINSSRPFICRIFDKNSYLQNKLNKKKWYFNMGDSLEVY